ncbi:MAG: hypothetical protein ABIF77_00155 [bacterium]
MPENLGGQDLARLVQRVFTPGPDDDGLAILVDLPDEKLADNPDWRTRRFMAHEWARLLQSESASLNLARISLAWYRNCGSNNADLPAGCVVDPDLETPADWGDIADRNTVDFADLFRSHSLILAPTELSTTAPLKVAARQYPFRAATMPGFLPSMIPALKIDYGEVNRRVSLLQARCNAADSASLVFRLDDGTRYELNLDLRHRTAHASGGLFPKNGVAGNLPSGEAYIVPYEGEIAGDPSRSAGQLPVQIDDEIVLYEIRDNRACQILSTGPISQLEAGRLIAEPAYANLAELGLGVLGDFGLKPAGTILLDEKLGLHIAFGRSDHFGGNVGPADFSSPENVIHLDRVYIPETQPRITVETVHFHGTDGESLLMSEGRYVEVFD